MYKVIARVQRKSNSVQNLQFNFKVSPLSSHTRGETGSGFWNLVSTRLNFFWTLLTKHSSGNPMFDGQLNQGGKCTALNNNNISTSHNFDSTDGHFFQVTIKNVWDKSGILRTTYQSFWLPTLSYRFYGVGWEIGNLSIALNESHALVTLSYRKQWIVPKIFSREAIS